MAKKSKTKKKFPSFCKVFDPKFFFHDFMRITGIPQAMLFYRAKKIYASKKAKKDAKKLEPYLVIANHNSFSDAIAIMSALWHRRMPFVIQNGVFEHKSAVFLKLYKCIEINRENVEFSTIKKCFETFRRGHCVGMFPEGRITSEDEVAAFKGGSSVIAWKSNVKILPIYIHKRKHWYNRQHLVIGEAIDPQDYINQDNPSMESFDHLTEALNESVRGLRDYYLNYLQTKESKKKKKEGEKI